MADKQYIIVDEGRAFGPYTEAEMKVSYVTLLAHRTKLVVYEVRPVNIRYEPVVVIEEPK